MMYISMICNVSSETKNYYEYVRVRTQQNNIVVLFFFCCFFFFCAFLPCWCFVVLCSGHTLGLHKNIRPLVLPSPLPAYTPCVHICCYSEHPLNSFDAFIQTGMQESTHKAPKSAPPALLGIDRMQLTLRATRRINTPRRFALGSGSVCLVAENPTCSVPAL